MWLIRPGRQGDDRFRYWLGGGYCAIGFREIRKPVPGGATQETILEDIRPAYPDKPKSWSSWTQSMYNFLTRMESGDTVVVRNGYAPLRLDHRCS